MGGKQMATGGHRHYKSTLVRVILVLALYWAARYTWEWRASGHLGELAVVTTARQSGFTIRHVFHHNAGRRHRVHKRLDITEQMRLEEVSAQEEDEWILSESPWSASLPLEASTMSITRLQERHPDFIESYLSYARDVGSQEAQKISLDWVTDDDVLCPNVSDKTTVVSLALMASNAYVKTPGTGDWQDVGPPWNNSADFGWMEDGLRGHVFANEDNSTVVVAIKGTSATGLTGGTDGETSVSDKFQDNLLFSCCCARVSYLWQTVCDCYESSYTCNQRCLEKEMKKEDTYYRAAMDIYRNVSSMYPDSAIWLTGHSLGGAISSLVGRTYGLPTVTFQAPGELLATKRLHLPMPPGIPSRMEHIWHFGHTADPLFLGVCNGASSTCAVAGYAMETQCHSGKTCVYDVVTDLGWHVSITNHRIHTVIDNVLLAYNETAECVVPPPCHDCYNWDFVVPDDKPTTTKTTHTSTSSTSTTEPGNCLKRTWYGRCIKWGKDPVPTTSVAHNTTLVTRTTTRSTSSRLIPTTATETDTPKKCVEYSWLGYCKRYEGEPYIL